MLIKKYIEFINEKMGVPDNIVNSATGLYQSILQDFNTRGQSQDLIFKSMRGKDLIDYKIDLPLSIKIGNLDFNSVELNVRLLAATKSEKERVDIISWGVLNMPDRQDDYKLYYDKSGIDKIYLNVIFVIASDVKFSDIYDYLNAKKSQMIGILSHELKHVYDKFMFGKSFLEDIIDYGTWSQTRTGFGPIDDFIYYLYVISKTESLVRPSEIAGEILTLDLTKSDFRKFLEENSTYKNLITIKNFTYDGLKKELHEDIENIKKGFIDIEDESDEEIVDAVLDITFDKIIRGQSKSMSDVLRLSEPNSILINNLQIKIFGMCKDIEFFKKYVDKRLFKDKDQFFIFWERKLKFEAEKTIKKITKLYDLCKDDDFNPLMLKINDRVGSHCIVNPELWNKMILKKNSAYKIKT